jgi:Bacterial dnaA protein helix-turn-helix
MNERLRQHSEWMARRRRLMGQDNVPQPRLRILPVLEAPAPEPTPEPEPVPVIETITKPVETTCKSIVALCAQYYDVTISDIKSRRRQPDVAAARQLAHYLARHTTLLSLPTIARHVGERDHTTVMHSLRAVAKRIARDPAFAADVERLLSMLGQED